MDRMKRMAELVQTLSEASRAYYQESRELMPNIEYDRLYDELLALEKETGRIRWARELSDRSESSPVAVYDTEGNGSIIQCAEDGKVILLDGLTGEVKAELQVEGKILASPAVYNDIMVVGTSGKGTESVVGIRIR